MLGLSLPSPAGACPASGSQPQSWTIQGLSPPTRGSQHLHQGLGVRRGSIPAHAGEPSGSFGGRPTATVYPLGARWAAGPHYRVNGETVGHDLDPSPSPWAVHWSDRSRIPLRRKSTRLPAANIHVLERAPRLRLPHAGRTCNNQKVLGDLIGNEAWADSPGR